MWCGRDGTHLEKVIDNEAMLTGEEAEASPKEETLTAMRYGHHTCHYGRTQQPLSVS